jgi:hypothetical protein
MTHKLSTRMQRLRDKRADRRRVNLTLANHGTYHETSQAILEQMAASPSGLDGAYYGGRLANLPQRSGLLGGWRF